MLGRGAVAAVEEEVLEPVQIKVVGAVVGVQPGELCQDGVTVAFLKRTPW